MAEEFPVGLCAGNWWTSPGNNHFGSSPCSSATATVGNFEWPSCHELIMDSKSTSDSSGGCSGGGVVVFQGVQKSAHQSTMSTDDSTMGIGGCGLTSSPSTEYHIDWNHTLLTDSEEIYSQIMQETGALNSGMNHRKQIPANNFSQDYDYINSFGQGNDHDYFPIYASTLLQDLFGDDDPQQLPPDGQEIINYFSGADYNGFNEPDREFLSPVASIADPSKQKLTNIGVKTRSESSEIATLTASLSSSSSAAAAKNNVLGFREKINGGRDLVSSGKKQSRNEPPSKRPRMETPSPLPAFKVRKEKLVDRITALQQLVSPFGKTDTASVLHEAIDCIKFLHDQVNVLSTPYLKNASHPHQHRSQVAANKRNGEEDNQNHDLRRIGLCLVPISVSFAATAETTSEYWTPTFGGCFS